MSRTGISEPASSAPIDRLELAVGWVRPGVAGIGGTLKPSSNSPGMLCGCFEGNDE